MRNVRKRIIIVMSAVTMIMLGTVATSALENPLEYSWNGYKCTVTVPMDVHENSTLTWGDESVQAMAGQTYELDLEDYVTEAFNSGEMYKDVDIICDYSGSMVPEFTICNVFFALNTEINAEHEVDRDIALSVGVDSVYMMQDPEIDSLSKLNDGQVKDYFYWINDSLVIKQGAVAAKGKLIYNWTKGAFRGSTAMIEDGTNQVVFLKLADNTTINDQGKWGVVIDELSYDGVIRLFDLSKWDNSPEKFVAEYENAIKGVVSGDPEKEAEYDAFMASIPNEDKIVFGKTAKGVNTADESNLIVWLLIMLATASGISAMVKFVA